MFSLDQYMLEFNELEPLFSKVTEVQTTDQAADLFVQLVAAHMDRFNTTREEATARIRTNIGYSGGYMTDEDRLRVETLFNTEHPILGSLQKRGSATSPQAFLMGMAVRALEEHEKAGGPRHSYRGRFVGNVADVYVSVNGTEHELPLHTEVRNHSPSGFAWGYAGSGPSQLSLAILMDHFRRWRAAMDFAKHAIQESDGLTEGEKGDPECLALALHQRFKFAVIAGLEQDKPWELMDDQVTRELIWLIRASSLTINSK